MTSAWRPVSTGRGPGPGEGAVPGAAVLQLQHVQANLAGAILNSVDLRRNSRYRGGYDFGRYGAYYA